LSLLLVTADQPQAGLFSGLVNTLTQVVDGAVGGLLSQGMWTVRIPAGAFDGTATVSLSALSSSNACQLEISPASKNAFAKPVTLTAKIPLTMSASSAQIQWYNPQTQAWETVPGSTVNALSRTVSAPLWHFSTYRVDGRSGW
jgi:hypothetical protein